MKFILVIIVALNFAYAKSCEALHTSDQIILVTTKDFQTSTGTLQRYERHHGKMVKVGELINVMLGRNGLGIGRGLCDVEIKNAPIKKEGDGKAPAGIFTLSGHFGYKTNLNPNFPYFKITPKSHCVDDANSPLYNQTFDQNNKPTYKSFEQMLRPDGQYLHGIFVGHNVKETINGAGSCIFIHIYKTENSPTAGCTAMSKEEIQTVISWLNAAKKPLLVQFPEEYVKTLKLFNDVD
jgi:D-alanyl-D-alanine dipeptidase